MLVGVCQYKRIVTENRVLQVLSMKKMLQTHRVVSFRLCRDSVSSLMQDRYLMTSSCAIRLAFVLLLARSSVVSCIMC